MDIGQATNSPFSCPFVIHLHGSYAGYSIICDLKSNSS